MSRDAVRRTVAADRAGILAAVVASGLFAVDDLAEVEAMLDAYLCGESRDEFWLTSATGSDVDGVAYAAAERMTEGTWNLLMLAVRGDDHGRGRGSDLVRAVEREIAEYGGRLLIVETSGVTAFAATRAFYVRRGFKEEARIRDFYRAGDDKVLYRKSLLRP